MNSGSSFAVLALASIDSATSKVLASNWRLVTWTLSESCGCVCSIRLCGARGFSKLRSLMYWPCRMSGPGGTMQGCTAQGAGRGKGRAIAKASSKDDDGYTFIARSGEEMDRSSLRPLVGISSCLKENGRGWHHTVGDKYVRAAIHAVGALPILIPAIGAEFGEETAT